MVEFGVFGISIEIELLGFFLMRSIVGAQIVLYAYIIERIKNERTDFSYGYIFPIFAIGFCGVTISNILHECGHILVARFHGILTESVVFNFNGGATLFSKNIFNLDTISIVLVLAAGPLTSFLVAVMLYRFRFVFTDPILQSSIIALSIVLVVVTLDNILPNKSLTNDGSRIFLLLKYGK